MLPAPSARRVHRFPGVAGQALSQAGVASESATTTEPTKHPAVKQWLAAQPRFYLHFTPTSASWLNLVERWFGLITAQAIRRSSFDRVARLEQAITRFLVNWNETAKPFRWTKSAHQIKRSIRNSALIYETRH